jgi:chaperonin GroES
MMAHAGVAARPNAAIFGNRAAAPAGRRSLAVHAEPVKLPDYISKVRRIAGRRPSANAARDGESRMPHRSLSLTSCALPQVAPKGDLVLARVAEMEEKTSGGIVLPNTAQKRPTSGDVVALGDGQVGTKTHSFTLQVGETVLYSKFGLGATDLELQGVEHILIREDDVIGVLPRSAAQASDIPDLRPVGDRVLVQVQEQGSVSVGGVILPDAAKERPVSGTVLRVGPGKVGDDGARVALKVKEGDRVVYFKYAGDAMETPDGRKYIVLHESDILCKA